MKRHRRARNKGNDEADADELLVVMLGISDPR